MRVPDRLRLRRWGGVLLLCAISWVADAQLPADADWDGSGRVDFGDFLLFAQAFGTDQSRFDLNRNGRVDFVDFLVFVELFGKRIPSEIVGLDYAGTAQEIAVILPGGAQMAFARIPAGAFAMGSPGDEAGRSNSEGPQHQVSLTRGFYLGIYEVTQGQWTAVMGTRPWASAGAPENSNHPVAHVSWHDAQAFVQKLNEEAGGVFYRLPTEAEWEYACRAGTGTPWFFGTDAEKIGDYAWYAANAWDMGLQYQSVGRKLPNGWGLYDMHGNVWEWCQDWYEAYTSSAKVDPQGPLNGSDRVTRGGDFTNEALGVRSANRYSYAPDARHDPVGFRVARKAE